MSGEQVSLVPEGIRKEMEAEELIRKLRLVCESLLDQYGENIKLFPFFPIAQRRKLSRTLEEADQTIRVTLRSETPKAAESTWIEIDVEKLPESLILGKDLAIIRPKKTEKASSLPSLATLAALQTYQKTVELLKKQIAP